MNSEVAELEASWRTLIAAGNEAFIANDGAAAQRYTEGLAIAERLFCFAKRDVHACRLAPMAHTIVCHNLVTLEFRAGRSHEAHNFLLRAVRKLVFVIESPASPEALRTSCLRHMEHALAFLAESVPNAMEEPKAAALVRRAFALRNRAIRATDPNPSAYLPSDAQFH
jgi:hypothetical protein